MTRVVLVTRGHRGIGRELATQLALRGDAAVLTARDLMVFTVAGGQPVGVVDKPVILAVIHQSLLHRTRPV
jgi:NAD(P)-dependent dehydrogenase (short-subunit alcohol dehydrogenase family)